MTAGSPTPHRGHVDPQRSGDEIRERLGKEAAYGGTSATGSGKSGRCCKIGRQWPSTATRLPYSTIGRRGSSPERTCALPIHWDPSEPLVAEAEHFSPTAFNWGRIQLRTTCVELMAQKEKGYKPARNFGARPVFKYYNITNDEDFHRAGKEAYEGRLTKEAYVAAIVDCESRAARRKRAFLHTRLSALGKSPACRNRSEFVYIARRCSNCKENLLLPHVERALFTGRRTNRTTMCLPSNLWRQKAKPRRRPR